MTHNFQAEIKAKYNLLGIESYLPEGEIQEGIQAPDWIHQGPIYEIFVRSFSQEGNFAAVAKKLGYLKDLGIKTIWLMPIHPIGGVKRKGTYGSPYAITDHMAIHSDYGNEQDFKNLVDAVHDHDMRLILDMVLNHAAPDHVKFSSQSAMFNSNLHHSPHEWSDIIEFNYQNSDTIAYAMNAMTYWVKEFGVDGYRCDVAGLVPLEFWQESVEQLLGINPNLFLLAEWENRVLHDKSFHATYDWTIYLLMKEVNRSLRPASDLVKWLEEQSCTYPLNALQLRFTENHDLPRTLNTFGYKSYLPFLAFILFSDGIPLINNGQEIGAANELSLFEKNHINWEAGNDDLFDIYKKLIRIRYAHKSLFYKRIEHILNDQSDNVVSFIRKNETKNLLFCLNFSDRVQEFRLETEIVLGSNKLTELITGNEIIFENNRGKLKSNEVFIIEFNSNLPY